MKYQYDFDWSGAEEQFEQAISLNPNLAYIRLAHGWYLMCVGNFEEADAEFEKAQQLDSHSLGISRTRGMLLLYERQYDKAIKHYLRMREVEPDSHRTNMYMSMAYQGKGMYAEAVEEFLEHGRIIGFLNPKETLGLREAFQTSGWQGYLRQRLVVANEKPKERRPFRPSFEQESTRSWAIRIPPSNGSKKALKITTPQCLHSRLNLRTTTYVQTHDS